MEKFSSNLLHSTYFVVDSDLLLKYAPPIEQTHYFQTCKILQYKKQLQSRLTEKQNKNKFEFNNQKRQKNLSNKKNFHDQITDSKYLQKAEQLNEAQLDEEIKATKKRLEELISQKKQRMAANHKKNVEQKEKNHNLDEQDQAYYYDQFYYPEDWYYYQNSKPNYKNNKYDSQNWSQYEKSMSQNEPKAKGRKHHHQSWYNYY